MSAILVLFASVPLVSAANQSLSPPPGPLVPPVVRQIYAGDVDRNQIDDALESRLVASKASRIKSGQSSQSKLEMIDVELIFSDPITQSQIDTFVQLGGQIDYIYKAVSYGWTGRIDAEDIVSLPNRMGASLVQVAPVYQVQFHMDVASQTGRVRPIWQPGFAGSQTGFRGDPNTTIAIIDSGVDGAHPDLAGRNAYWTDVSSETTRNPIDYEGHGSAVAGVAVGTGQIGGAAAGVLRYTHTGDFSTWSHHGAPISLPPGPVEVVSQAYWGGASAWLEHVLWRRGTDQENLKYVGLGQEGSSFVSYSNTLSASAEQVFSPVLVDWSFSGLDKVVITNVVPGYPAIGDGFNTFSGVAPGCKWAAAKVKAANGIAGSGSVSRAIDDFVARRIEKNIQVINISLGLYDQFGLPLQSEAIRDKVVSAVHNGVVVVISAGNSGDVATGSQGNMGDPAMAAMAITVGASNDGNILTTYSSYGPADPNIEEAQGFKPDLIAPGGSYYYTGIMSVDSGTADIYPGQDKQPNDYTGVVGTSLASPFVAGCAALVIEAMAKQGIDWDFTSDSQPRYVKMLLCATASETNADRENGLFNPTLQRASAGPEGFPVGKDRYEGYGLINPDAAVEAVSLTYIPGETVVGELGDGPTDRRVWARTVALTAGETFGVSLDTPAGADFDLYLYSSTPSDTGEPILLDSSTQSTGDADESIIYTPDSDTPALLVVKRVIGSGQFELGPNR